MTMAGLEIEHIDNPADTLAAFTVAHVKAAEPHPDADRLRVCTVDTVDGEKQIVCGAPNARAGMTAIYAPLGTYIPGLDFALDKKPRKIRGIESHGMLCSTKEIEAGEDHDGIADLEGDWPVGTPAAKALGLDDPSSILKSRRTGPTGWAFTASRVIWPPPAQASGSPDRSSRSRARDLARSPSSWTGRRPARFSPAG